MRGYIADAAEKTKALSFKAFSTRSNYNDGGIGIKDDNCNPVCSFGYGYSGSELCNGEYFNLQAQLIRTVW
ncbi:MAG: hypothetical protein ABIP79_08865 [Chitinophagaceae bacterium]